jgi:UDP-N-acetylmuramoylalanine--D-glutamate ligase
VSRFVSDPSALPGTGDRVFVLGFGLSGEAAARHLVRLGASVSVADRADDPLLRERSAALPEAHFLLGAADEGAAEASAADLIVASPGVPERSPALAAAREGSVPVWSEIELAFRMARAPIVGITGTNGKTTTTQMLAAALSAAGMRATAAGNIGHPLSDAAVEDHEVIVAELSSFQLMHISSFRAPVGLLLNVAPDHIDRHGSFTDYVAAKARLFENQAPEDVAIHHADAACADAASRSRGRRVPFDGASLPDAGAGVDAEGWIVVPEGRVLAGSRLRARGAPALANAVAAAAGACAFGAPVESVAAALSAFEPLPHRMELVAEIGGVAYVNDSKATNPHAVLAALDGLERVVLIAGGRNKGLDLGAISTAAAKLVAVIAIGESAGEIEEAFRGSATPVERAAAMDEAVGLGASLATTGGTVLLSPGCASFDMFVDYKARGEAFRAAVKRLEATARTGEGNR